MALCSPGGIALAFLQGHPTSDLQYRLEITWRRSESFGNPRPGPPTIQATRSNLPGRTVASLSSNELSQVFNGYDLGLPVHHAMTIGT